MTEKIQQIYQEINTLENSLLKNENKANELRKSFEKLLKLILGYDPSESKITLHDMINEYATKQQKYNLQYICHTLRKDLNQWSHDTPNKLDDIELNDYIVRYKNIIQVVSGLDSLIKKEDIQIPIIILTSLTDMSNLSKGYELGCNDYLKKPFDLIELRYRIDQLIKNKCFTSDENIIILNDNFAFDIQKNILYKEQKPIDLTQKESEVISFLIQNRGFYISIESLHENIWDNKDIQYADIRMCIKRIRDKTDKNFIITKRFVGYKIDK